MAHQILKTRDICEITVKELLKYIISKNAEGKTIATSNKIPVTVDFGICYFHNFSWKIFFWKQIVWNIQIKTCFQKSPIQHRFWFKKIGKYYTDINYFSSRWSNKSNILRNKFQKRNIKYNPYFLKGFLFVYLIHLYIFYFWLCWGDNIKYILYKIRLIIVKKFSVPGVMWYHHIGIKWNSSCKRLFHTYLCRLLSDR